VNDLFCQHHCSEHDDVLKNQMLKTHFGASIDLESMKQVKRITVNDGQLIVLDTNDQLIKNKEIDNSCISVLLPSCNEEDDNLKNTINSLLENAVQEVQILVGIDGSDEESLDHPSVVTRRFKQRIGKRKVLNELASISSGDKFFILDSHCAITKGWDKELKKYHLRNSILQTTLDSLSPRKSDGTLYWKGKGNRYDFVYLNTELKDKWWLAYSKRLPKNWKVTETMGLTGCGFLIDKELFYHLGGYNESFGELRGAEGPEWACKVWLSGGQVLMHRNVITAHLFKKKEPYTYSIKKLRDSYSKVKECFWNRQGPHQIFSPDWLAERFNPVPKWEEYFENRK